MHVPHVQWNSFMRGVAAGVDAGRGDVAGTILSDLYARYLYSLRLIRTLGSQNL